MTTQSNAQIPLAKRVSTGSATVFALLTWSTAVSALPTLGGGQLTGTARVVDGDTIDVDGRRVRLEGIDAPELAQTCQTETGSDWPCGRKAAATLRGLVENKAVACAERGLDKYNRVLAVCSAGGVNVNETMVKAGMAWAFVKYSAEFSAVEAEARALKTGVWQGAATAPWDFRQGRWHTAEIAAPSGCAIKGNISDGGHIYHVPWSAWYDKVRIDEAAGERWFCSEADAAAAGWRPALSK